VLWSFLSVVGCAPLGPFPDPSGGESPGPDGILVDPAVIDFGVFDFPDKPDDPQFLTSTFSVYNAGLDAINLQGQGDVIGSNAFTVQGSPGPDTLAGHEVVEYTVVFQPTVDDLYEGEISLNLGDASIELRGEADAPRLDVQDTMQISTPYGCAQPHSLRVQNIGHDPLTLDLNDFSDGGPRYGLSWASNQAAEVLLEPGGVIELGMTFEPTDDEIDKPHEIEARIGTNEPGDPIRTIAITATATEGEDTVDSFRFDTDLQSSLLIVPDTRPGMATSLADFASAADSLVAAIASKNDNGVQVAVVGGADGVPCPTTERPFYDTRVDKPEDIAAAIATGLTDAGASTGNLLELAQGAVYEMADKHCLDGFLRPGTSLHVLLLSNGSEDSFNDPTTYAQSIVNEVTALRGTGAEISVFVPGGQDCTDDGCTRLIAASSFLGGSVWDLSTGDWNVLLDSYGGSLVPPQGDLPLLLSQAAHISGDLADDIVLTADGGKQPISSDWYSYDSGLRAVMLDMAAPIPAGSVVQVSYLPDAVCK
jgi:hypothetical protein